MALSAEFKALCADPWGEALQVRLWVRLNDSSGGPGTLMEITAAQEVLALNPLRRRREREFGVVQGQSWQVQVTNKNKALLAYDFKDCWCAIEAGFPVADEWTVRSQGKIKKVTRSAGGTVIFEVQDSVVDVLNYELQRDMRFQSTGWASGVQVLSKVSGSQSWDTTVALDVGSPENCNDETFIIEFTTPSNYKVILEDGDETQTGTISSDLVVNNVSADPILTIPAAGWSTDSGAYADGDQFIFYTSRPRTSDQLTAIYMVAHLIDYVLGLTAYDVLGGANYASARADTDAWDDAGDAAVTSQHIVQGFFARGTPIVSLIQDALKLVHGSIYPTSTGQIGLWVLAPVSDTATSLNGVPGRGQIDILDNMTVEDDLETAISKITFTYKTIDGEDGTCESIDSATLLQAPRTKIINLGWECRGLSVQDACDKYLARYKQGIREYAIPTTIAGLVADIGFGVSFAEGELDLDATISDVTDIEEDLLDNAVTLRGHTDPLVTADYFDLDSSLLDGAEVLW